MEEGLLERPQIQEVTNMKSYERKGYFTTWMFDSEKSTSSHRIYYNDIDIATGNYMDGDKVVGNVRMVDRHMALVDRRANYMW